LILHRLDVVDGLPENRIALLSKVRILRFAAHC